jgi:hypothetical protein
VNTFIWMIPLVFVGPTLSQQDCLQLLDAELFPPARLGGLTGVMPGHLVAIIDGELPPGAFLPDCEIEAALDRGVVLYGAASVGASRASTFADHGMRGVGWVYEQYRAGRLSSFDEVAVLYDPLSLQALSVPLVNVRFWLDRLVAASRITVGDACGAFDEVCQLSLWDRNVATIKRCLKKHLAHEEIEMPSTFPNVKENDARRLLRLLGRISREGPGAFRREAAASTRN